MNKIQESLLTTRAMIEIFFTDPTLPDHALAQLARIHGGITATALEAEGWVQVPPEPPKIVVREKPKPRPQYPSDKNRRKTPTVRAQKAAKIKGAQPRHVLARTVVCPKCFAVEGQPCFAMTLGKNNRPTKNHTAGGTSHEERRAAYTKWSIDKAIAEQNPDVQLPDEVVDKLYGAGINGDIIDDPMRVEIDPDDEDVMKVYV